MPLGRVRERKPERERETERQKDMKKKSFIMLVKIQFNKKVHLKIK